jgi:hypothetical protein
MCVPGADRKAERPKYTSILITNEYSIYTEAMRKEIHKTRIRLTDGNQN